MLTGCWSASEPEKANSVDRLALLTLALGLGRPMSRLALGTPSVTFVLAELPLYKYVTSTSLPAPARARRADRSVGVPTGEPLRAVMTESTGMFALSAGEPGVRSITCAPARDGNRKRRRS